MNNEWKKIADIGGSIIFIIMALCYSLTLALICFSVVLPYDIILDGMGVFFRIGTLMLGVLILYIFVFGLFFKIDFSFAKQL